MRWMTIIYSDICINGINWIIQSVFSIVRIAVNLMKHSQLDYPAQCSMITGFIKLQETSLLPIKKIVQNLLTITKPIKIYLKKAKYQ